ncbi:MAG: DUF3050 domain-containing protein [Bacteriovoracaceae bacterium]
MQTIIQAQKNLTFHPVYSTFKDLKSIQHFMQYHVFAVWDFMSLLKSLQQKLTCVAVPWTPSPYPAEVVRLINQIVLGEESDLDQDENPISHFDLYLKAMEEVGASTALIRDFLTDLDLEKIPLGAREFVSHNLDVAKNGHVVEVAASFFFGREKLIPDMFRSMVDVLKKENIHAPTFIYYLERHIAVDGDEHGPLALQCLESLTQGNPELVRMSELAGMNALKMRNHLWDQVLKTKA